MFSSPRTSRTVKHTVHSATRTSTFTRLKSNTRTTASPASAYSRRRQHKQQPTKVMKPENIPNRFPENPSAEQKLRCVFEELDLHDTLSVERDGLHRVLGALGIDFTTATIDDLYDRMDVNGCGRVTLSEYKDWAAHYPTLIDAIYNRSRAAVEKVRGEAIVEAKLQGMSKLEKRERATNSAWQEALKDLRQAEREVATVEEVIEERKDAEKRAAREVLEAERDASFARTEVDAKRKAHQAAKAEERDAFTPLSAADTQIEKMDNQMVAFQNTLYELQDKERVLVRELEALKTDIKQTVEAIGEAEIEVDKSKEWAEELKKQHEEAVQAVDECWKEIQEAERFATKQEEYAVKSSRRQKEALASTKHAEEDLKRAKQDMRQLKQREEEKRADHQAAAGKLDEADTAVRALEHDIADHHNNCVEQEHDEQALLEHEVRLREQRYNLDDRDDVHWDEATRFLTTNRLPDTRKGVVAHSPHNTNYKPTISSSSSSSKAPAITTPSKTNNTNASSSPSSPISFSPTPVASSKSKLSTPLAGGGGGHISMSPHAGLPTSPVRQRRA